MRSSTALGNAQDCFFLQSYTAFFDKKSKVFQRILGGLDDKPEGCAAVQRELERLENWVKINLLKFNKMKCKVFHLSRNNPMHHVITNQ